MPLIRMKIHIETYQNFNELTCQNETVVIFVHGFHSGISVLITEFYKYFMNKCPCLNLGAYYEIEY